MSKIIKLLLLDEVSMLYLFSFFIIGIIHKNKELKAYGIVIGFWRFQTQFTIGYSEELVTIIDEASAGETGYA
tara:strand:- start:137 stop:355 length:219 start_codon:yes stop_codon:yes gene_type:complete